MKRKLSGRKRKGVVLMIMACALMFIVIPSVGLAIDGAVVYSVRAMLQSATDAAAVSAVQAYSRGLSPIAQQGTATTTATRYFRANINAAWVPMTAPDPAITFPTSAQPRTMVINVVSSAAAPTYFMKIMGVNTVTVTAMAEASRRDVKIMMVLDRSGSLSNSGSCDDLREAARGFTDAFVDGRDQLGMITFGTSYRVDFPISYSFKTNTGTTLPTMINNINCIGGTNSAAAYWTGYQSLVEVPEAGVLNVLLFFTDGQPNTVTVGNMEVQGGYCASNAPKTGVIAPSSGGGSVLGIYKAVPTGPPPVTSDQYVISGSTGCKYNSNNANVYQDIVALTRANTYAPFVDNQVDIFGNSLLGYKTGVLTTNGRIRINDNATIVNAGINALDSAARRARDDAFGRGLELTTFAIGLSNSLGAAEDVLMNRIANTGLSTAFQADRNVGMYVRADDATQLDEAFGHLASDIMRVAK